MINNMADILHEKELLISRLDKLLYGAVELREQKENIYIYVHYREEGIQKTKYAGEFSNELYNLIIEKNNLANQYLEVLKTIREVSE